VQVLLVATKLDKEPRSARKTALRRLQDVASRKILGFSSITGEGREDLWRALRRAALGEVLPADAAPAPEPAPSPSPPPPLPPPLPEASRDQNG